MSESTIDPAMLRAMLREERRMKSWTSEQYPLETLDKAPTEDKIDISNEYGLWVGGEEIIWDGDEPIRPIESWRELAPEERLLLYIEILDMIPEEQLTEEVREAISEAITETERKLCEPR
ncbi:hypothetical protein LCGC14_1176440 [marine sediment metagenome]|uniref:Uncharacterized protein n=1 Tax=marine sediment metagenome TaxID=412755 RepID=A0A0F9MB86_9ZZZZ